MRSRILKYVRMNLIDVSLNISIWWKSGAIKKTHVLYFGDLTHVMLSDWNTSFFFPQPGSLREGGTGGDKGLLDCHGMQTVSSMKVRLASLELCALFSLLRNTLLAAMVAGPVIGRKWCSAE